MIQMRRVVILERFLLYRRRDRDHLTSTRGTAQNIQLIHRRPSTFMVGSAYSRAAARMIGAAGAKASASAASRRLSSAAGGPSLDGKICWVIGGAGIIGTGIARGLLRAGATVIVNSRESRRPGIHAHSGHHDQSSSDPNSPSSPSHHSPPTLLCGRAQATTRSAQLGARAPGEARDSQRLHAA